MLPLTLTDRRGETYAVFRADDIIPFGYYPADIDRGFGWAERFVFSLSLPEQRRLRDYAYGMRPVFGLDPLIELLAQRRLLIYRKDTSKDDKLAIEVLRNSIREVLDQILAEEKKEADAIAREHEKRNILEKGLAYKQEFDKGMAEGAWSLLKFLKEVNDVVSPMMILTRAGKSAWDAAEGGLQGFAGRFSRNMNTAQYREIVEALGFDPAEIDQKTLYLAFDIANVVWEDKDTQAIITRFAKNLAAAQHSLEWANIAGGAAFEIVLTAILAALTAGAGATVALAGKGKYLRKLGELLRDLAEPLKRLKRRWGKGSRGKGAGSGNKAVVEEVETPGYNEPHKRKATSVDDNVKPENEAVGASKGFELSPDDIAKLRANQFAHTLERHGPDVTVDQLKRRATEGIAPDNSTIPKYQGGNRIGNVIPPLSSKFESAETLKLALDTVDANSPAFANALVQAQSNLLPGQSLTRFKFEVDLGQSVGFGYQRPPGTPNFVLTGQKLQGEPVRVNNLSKVEARYQLNPATGKFELNTLFPVM